MGEVVLDEWRLWQEAQGLAERTITERATVVRHLLSFTGCGPLELTAHDIVRFTARQDITATSRATYHATIRAYCRWLITVGHRNDDPAEKTPRPRRPKGRPRPVPAVHLDTILQVVNRRRTRMMLMLALLAGLRVHEIAKIRGEDLDIVDGTLTVTGKGGKTAVLPAHPRLIAEASTFPRHGWWFPAYEAQGGGEHITSRAVSAAIMRTMRRAGYQGKAHQLRHSYGTALLAAGVDLRVVQTLMRHESPATTAIYTEVDVARQIDGIARLTLPDEPTSIAA